MEAMAIETIGDTPSGAARIPMHERLRQRQREGLSQLNTSSSPRKGLTTSTSTRRRASVKPAAASSRANATARILPELDTQRFQQERLRRDDTASPSSQTATPATDVSSDISPAGREGRNFAVAKVGNGGRIYLRPTVRPTNQRYPQKPVVRPTTPSAAPRSSAANPLGSEASPTQDEEAKVKQSNVRTQLKNAAHLNIRQNEDSPSNSLNQQAPHTRHERAQSYSTISEQGQLHLAQDAGAMKVVIDRSAGYVRPKTTEDAGSSFPLLDIQIPSYKLGTPRFSVKGTAFLRNSSYTTDDIRSSVFTQQGNSPGEHIALRLDTDFTRRHSYASPHQHFLRATSSGRLTPVSTMPLISPHTPWPSAAIEPAMFDSLTFKPTCDDKAVVRYSAATGAITAATPPRLVAEITSPSLLDYDLLSDFFLTFRTFLSTSDLVAILFARMGWAIARDDEMGMVVRVRTFVAIRHWVLNYFVDDFVANYGLRQELCRLLNAYVHDLIHTPAVGTNKLKILTELKKCWRRTCALYWDGPEFAANLEAQVPVHPGGLAGSRDPHLDPSFFDGLEEVVKPPQLEDFLAKFSLTNNQKSDAHVSHAEYSELPYYQSRFVNYHGNNKGSFEEPPISLYSLQSEDVVSCSFPSRTTRTAHNGVTGSRRPLRAHPIPATHVPNESLPVAVTPKALGGKRVRPVHAHKRSGSFSDSMREEQTQPHAKKIFYKNTELLLTMPFAGSLVRGNLIPPGQAFVEVLAPSTPSELTHQTTFLVPSSTNGKEPSAMSGPGMKKLLGSVRRALSTKHGNTRSDSPTQGSFPDLPSLGQREATTNRIPGTAIVPQAGPRNTGAHAPTRIDLLGASVAEDFKRAVREHADAGFQRNERSSAQSEKDLLPEGMEMQRGSFRCPDDSEEKTILGAPPPLNRAPASEMTTGSKSILIIDDTLPLEVPFMMTRSLSKNLSFENMTEGATAVVPGLTPPTTPPERAISTTKPTSIAIDESDKVESRTVPIQYIPRASTEIQTTSPDRHRSQLFRKTTRSSRGTLGVSYRSGRSVSLRRYASYQSGSARHGTERSFDATTLSDSHNGLSSPSAAPAPLRSLRRRPGGDLRAVNKVSQMGVGPLRRTHSTGSMTTYSESLQSMYLVEKNPSVISTETSEVPEAIVKTFSIGAMAEPARRATSLFSTHSSQPIMRASFEAEAQKLAQIPDDVDDDGGVESALLKLEGKFEKRNSDAGAENHEIMLAGSSLRRATRERPSSIIFDEAEKRRHRHKHIIDSFAEVLPPETYRPQPLQQPLADRSQPAVYKPVQLARQSHSVRSLKSDDSYSSIPLFQRGLDEHNNSIEPLRDWTDMSVLQVSESYEKRPYTELTPESSHPSYDFVEGSANIKELVDQEKSRQVSGDRSFLHSGSEAESDVSSEMSLEFISHNDISDENTSGDSHALGSGADMSEVTIPSHPLHQPPSPPLTMIRDFSAPSETSPTGPSHWLDKDNSNVKMSHAQVQKALPPTPQQTPTAATAIKKEKKKKDDDDDDADGHNPPQALLQAPAPKPSEAPPLNKSSVHLPFTLAFDSEVLAQQFTLIEKDALNEIDWRELIEMRWATSSGSASGTTSNGAQPSSSWVEYLRSQGGSAAAGAGAGGGGRGVGVVIARFNIVVKWAVSECVLTADVGERARCIVKYIHVAAHCRRLRNFATMCQLTVALTCRDVARLARTWRLVPAADVATLRRLEALVRPSRNFHDLRAEMEGGGGGGGGGGKKRSLEQGCIPFVGIYTHDLLFNAQRPSQIASTPHTEPLVNFEKCRTTAAVAKTLLRLLEASSRYAFAPVEGLTERCLWMSALSDDEIRRRGEEIE